MSLNLLIEIFHLLEVILPMNRSVLFPFKQKANNPRVQEEVARSLEKVRVPHQELDDNIDNMDSLIGNAAEQNGINFACK
jgi:hypothetical protein